MAYATYEWCLKQDFSKYRGKWLALADDRVVASGSDVAKVIEEFKRVHPDKRPFLTKVASKLSVFSGA